MTKQTVPCERCKTPTLMLGTKLCNNCWEITKRAPDYWELREYKERTEAALVDLSHIVTEIADPKSRVMSMLRDRGLWRDEGVNLSLLPDSYQAWVRSRISDLTIERNIQVDRFIKTDDDSVLDRLISLGSKLKAYKEVLHYLETHR